MVIESSSKYFDLIVRAFWIKLGFLEDLVVWYALKTPQGAYVGKGLYVYETT